MKKEILVLCPGEPDLGLLSKAAELALPDKRNVHFLTDSAEKARMAFKYGADRADIIIYKGILSDDYLFASWLRDRVKNDWNPEMILSPANIRMRAVMPILAGMLDAGLTCRKMGSFFKYALHSEIIWSHRSRRYMAFRWLLSAPGFFVKNNMYGLLVLSESMKYQAVYLYNRLSSGPLRKPVR